MALSPIAFIAPNYRDFKNYWLKAYEQGTTTPLSMALDSAGAVTVAKLELNKDGFLESAGGSLVIPYIDGAYDAFLFPTEAEADANDTVNAEQVADNITGFNDAANEVISNAIQKYTLADAKALTTALEGQIVQITDRADGQFEYKTGQTPNTFNIVQCTGVGTLALVLRVSDKVDVNTLGTITNSVYVLSEAQNNREAISRSIDLALSTGAKKVVFSSDKYFISDVIFLPRTLLAEGVLVIDGTGAKLLGPVGDTINIFETAKTTFSWNGITNWGEAPEAFIHANTHLKNFSYENYDIALRLYNFNFNCKVSGSTWNRGKTGLHAKRCFYMTLSQNNLRAGYVGKPDGEITVLFEDFTNVLYCNDNHVSNWDGTQATGIGIKSIGGANAFNLSEWTIEGNKIGLWLGGENRPFNIDSNYFEANEISIFHDNGALSGTVDNNWFADPITYEAASGIADQLVWGKNFNVNNGTITESSSVSSLQIIDGAQFANSSDYTTGVARPAEQQLGNSSKFLNEGFQIAYDPVSGFAGAGGRSLIPYVDMLMPFNYFGRLFRINTPIPFVDISYSNPTLTLDTQIQFLANYNGGVVYDLTINHNAGTDYIAGRTLGNASVVQFDAVGHTVTMVDNGGFMRFTITGFDVTTTPTIFGRIRAT